MCHKTFGANLAQSRNRVSTGSAGIIFSPTVARPPGRRKEPFPNKKSKKLVDQLRACCREASRHVLPYSSRLHACTDHKGWGCVVFEPKRRSGERLSHCDKLDCCLQVAAASSREDQAVTTSGLLHIMILASMQQTFPHLHVTVYLGCSRWGDFVPSAENSLAADAF